MLHSGPVGVEECEDNDCDGCAWCDAPVMVDEDGIPLSEYREDHGAPPWHEEVARNP
jgi:hypothetical protein